MADLLNGTSGWSYSDTADKGWVGAFYPNKSIMKLPYYSQFLNTAEFDAIYYAKLYENMSRGTFEGMVNSTPKDRQETIRLFVRQQGADNEAKYRH